MKLRKHCYCSVQGWCTKVLFVFLNRSLWAPCELQEAKKWKESSYSWGRVWQSFYIKIIILQLQWPSWGFKKASFSLLERKRNFPLTKHLSYILQLPYLSSKGLSSKWLFLYMWNMWAAKAFTDLQSHFLVWYSFLAKMKKKKKRQLWKIIFISTWYPERDAELGNIMASLFGSSRNPNGCILNELYWAESDF